MEESPVVASAEPLVVRPVSKFLFRRPSYKTLIIVAVVFALVALAVLSYVFYFKGMFEEQARETHRSALEQLSKNENGATLTEAEKKAAVLGLPGAPVEASFQEKQAALRMLGR